MDQFEQFELIWTSLNQFEGVWTKSDKFEFICTSLVNSIQVWFHLNKDSMEAKTKQQQIKSIKVCEHP